MVYFPPDVVLPQSLSDSLGVTKYLHKGRVRSIRLKGEPSFGLITTARWNDHVGDNVANRYPDVIKYEPPVRHFSPHPYSKEAQDPKFPVYTHICNLRHHPTLIGKNELVVITEKLHGTNSRIGLIDGKWYVGSHMMRRGPEDMLYNSPKTKRVERLLSDLGRSHKQVILFGEILGDNVQSLNYGFKGHDGYRAFDLMVDGKYLDWFTFSEICRKYKVKTVPVLSFSRYTDLHHIKKLATGKTKLSDHMSEGVIVKPVFEKHHPKIGRLVLKYVSDEFLLAKKSDFKEE